MAVLYKFLDVNNDLLYIGISDNDILTRLKQHTHLSTECYELVEFVEYCEFDTKCDVELIERYLVSKYKPNFNTMYSNKDITITIPEFDNLKYTKMRYNFKDKSEKVNLNRYGGIQITSYNNELSNLDKKLELNLSCDGIFPFKFWFDVEGKFFIKDENLNLDFFASEGVFSADGNFKLTITGEWEIDAFIREMKKVIENYEKSIIDMR